MDVISDILNFFMLMFFHLPMKTNNLQKTHLFFFTRNHQYKTKGRRLNSNGVQWPMFCPVRKLRALRDNKSINLINHDLALTAVKEQVLKSFLVCGHEGKSNQIAVTDKGLLCFNFGEKAKLVYSHPKTRILNKNNRTKVLNVTF